MPQLLKKHSLVLLALALTLMVIGTSAFWLTNKPKPTRKPAQDPAPLVETISLELTEHPITITAFGNVMAAQSVNLNARVDGMVIDVTDNFIDGGLLKQGEKIVQLDPVDYELRVRERQSDLAKAEFDLKLEQGQQAIARQEFELLGQNLDDQARELVLRRPHLRSARARVDAARAALEQARLNLERTQPFAPFNAIILQRNANVGSWVSTFSTGTPLVKLAGTDYFWIDVSVPMNQVRWLTIPGINTDQPQGSEVKVRYEQAWLDKQFRQGYVKRLKAEVDPSGRMAKLIVQVDDPLALEPDNQGQPVLTLGTLVKVELTGQTLTEIYRLPESALHDGRHVWLMTDDSTLDIRAIKPVWTENGMLFIAKGDLPQNARVITSRLAAPVQGMTLRVQ